MLAWQRRWEALLLGAILLAVTAIGALLVASPRRVLVMMPLVAALAGVGELAARRWRRRIRIDPSRVNAGCATGIACAR